MSDTLLLILEIGTALFWSLTYILIIFKGFQDKTYGMPMLALCANLSWEFIFSFIWPLELPRLYITIIWFSLDLIILLQFLLFGKLDFKNKFYRKLFYPIFFLLLLISFFTILFISYEFDDYIGKYAAFGQNLLMSILFITMLIRRNSTSGQSIYIAIFKLIGTLFASSIFYLNQGSILITFFSIATLFFDIAYIILLAAQYTDLDMRILNSLKFNIKRN
ncbi:hypothetical protein [Orenia marismortui]|uniref:Uncharacterized protein n=1 Tax=Orenia marismortui TaxID=46469 RepID=A0A4R8H1C9_9FIRM|nr:hypothetical protein [Orenia marismortui]TDX48343.1 hypothetical protein C7959_1294 [Orenia marismortui]